MTTEKRVIEAGDGLFRYNRSGSPMFASAEAAEIALLTLERDEAKRGGMSFDEKVAAIRALGFDPFAPSPVPGGLVPLAEQVRREREQTVSDAKRLLEELEKQEAWEHFARQCLEAAVEALPSEHSLIGEIHAVLG